MKFEVWRVYSIIQLFPVMDLNVMITTKNLITILFSVFSFALFSSLIQADDFEGIDTFIEMCKNNGDNPTLIRNIYVEAEMTDDFISDANTMKMEKQKRRIKFLLAAKDSIHNMVKITSQRWDFEKNEWRVWTTRLRLSADTSVGEKEINIYNHDDNPEVTIDNSPMLIPAFHTFGRIKGFTAFAATLDLLKGRVDYANYDFSKENIAFYKAKNSTGIKASGNKQFEKIGTKKYDVDSIANVIESFYQGKTVERYWTDPSRGYICPLVQLFYTDTGKLAFEYKSENFVLHKDSGLWYPGNYSETIFDKTGKIKRKSVYHIEVNTLKINQVVSDDEFSLDIKERAYIVDERPQNAVIFRSLNKGVLSLVRDDLNLSKKDWLHEGVELPLISSSKSNAHMEHDKFQEEMKRKGEKFNEELQKKGVIDQERIKKQIDEQQHQRTKTESL
jgi:hypothetical protein